MNADKIEIVSKTIEAGSRHPLARPCPLAFPRRCYSSTRRCAHINSLLGWMGDWMAGW